MKQLREGLRGVSNNLKPDQSVLTFSRSSISGLQVAFNEKVGIINEKKVGKSRTTCTGKLVIWVQTVGKDYQQKILVLKELIQFFCLTAQTLNRLFTVSQLIWEYTVCQCLKYFLHIQ